MFSPPLQHRPHDFYSLLLYPSQNFTLPPLSSFCSEQEFIRSSNKMPRLERYFKRKGASSRSRKGGLPSSSTSKLPLPEGFGNEDWDWPNGTSDGPKIAFIVTTAESVYQIKLWMAYHRALGVSTFYLFVEGQAGTPEAIAALSTEPGVTIIPNDDKLQARHAGSRIWSESWLYAFFNKPCNHELFVRQSLNMEMGIELAIEQRVEWILHIDTDEVIYPGGTRDYSLKELLKSVPENVDALVFPNYESLAETIEVEDPFTEVTLFKRSYSHVHSEDYFGSYGTVARGNPNYFTTYGNGKSAARVQDGLRPNGAHRWHNYNKEPMEWSSEQAAVLHYTYNRFADLKSRRDRCDCKPTEEDAERCFILPFDRLAFLEASLKNDDQLLEWFKERLVWEDQGVVVDLIKKGLFSRLYEPQILIRGLKEAMRKKGISKLSSSTTTNGTNKTTVATTVGTVPKNNIPLPNGGGGGGANSRMDMVKKAPPLTVKTAVELVGKGAAALSSKEGQQQAASQMQQAQRRRQQEMTKKAQDDAISTRNDDSNRLAIEDENSPPELSDREVYLRETAADAIDNWKRSGAASANRGSRRELTTLSSDTTTTTIPSSL